MVIKVRSEQTADYNAVANVNYEAFLGWHPDNPYVSEPVMVDLLRHNSLFDPELSLVAEADGQIIGHALFSPFSFVVLGRKQAGAVLGPIAVKPEFQKTGIGGALIEESHKRLKQKGFGFSLLCGHDTYYPRFGYETKMFSEAGAKIGIRAAGFDGSDLVERPVTGQDMPWIINAWQRQYAESSLALYPGNTVCEWMNTCFKCRCSMISRGDRLLGYVRYVMSAPVIIKELLANKEDMPEILTYLAYSRYGEAGGDLLISLPVEMFAGLIDENNKLTLKDERNAYTAFMIRVLDDNSPISQYCEKVRSGLIKPGIVRFPSIFDVDDGRVD
ncbi:MAG TPA: N-acetyltransferase [Clostridia bacterium]|nr:N-acetyltransferase [Clostridia bacterium]